MPAVQILQAAIAALETGTQLMPVVMRIEGLARRMAAENRTEPTDAELDEIRGRIESRQDPGVGVNLGDQSHVEKISRDSGVVVPRAARAVSGSGPDSGAGDLRVDVRRQLDPEGGRVEQTRDDGARRHGE